MLNQILAQCIADQEAGHNSFSTICVQHHQHAKHGLTESTANDVELLNMFKTSAKRIAKGP